MSNQKIAFLVGGALIVGIVIGVGISNPSTKSKTTVQESVIKQETPSSTPIASSTITAESEKTSPAANKSVETVKPSPIVKQNPSYSTVFTFSGDGAKKSEPFTITGSRFKIKYSCNGDFCQAYLYKVGSDLMSSLIMNKAGSTSDETIFYSAGQYYIDANIIGSYAMTVEDFK